MTTFLGSSKSDLILRHFLSSGVVTDPAGASGTLTGEWNFIDAGAGDDIVALGNGVVEDGVRYGDEAYGGDGDDIVLGGAGRDFIDGGVGRDALFGGGGNDTLNGARGADLLDGGSGSDVLDGTQGSDVMRGGDGWDYYYVDSHGDVVIERAGEGLDSIQTLLRFYVAPRNVEGLSYWGASGGTVHFVGNGGDNVMQLFSDVAGFLVGRGGDDGLSGGVLNDTILGGDGDDLMNGGDRGADLIRGGDGDDTMYASAYEADGRDTLVGGDGADVFIYQAAIESTRAARDVIRAGDGAPAFQGAGAVGGDVLDLSNMDADETDLDFSHLSFGGTGKGTVSCVDRAIDTLVRANVDDDKAFEFQLLIKDGQAAAAADYTADDFLLTYV